MDALQTLISSVSSTAPATRLPEVVRMSDTDWRELLASWLPDRLHRDAEQLSCLVDRSGARRLLVPAKTIAALARDDQAVRLDVIGQLARLAY